MQKHNDKQTKKATLGDVDKWTTLRVVWSMIKKKTIIK
jgi:hypothetical protein